MANNHCKECGCICSKCSSTDQDVHLHVEIENLKQHLVERDNHIVTMETNFLNEANKYPNGELVAIRDELVTWQDKYKRLYESHRRVQRVNQGLEDKLLRLVDVTETDKNTLTKDVATLSHKLAEANYQIKKLREDNERYKNDVSLAIQFLQCKPGNFVSHKFDSLPNEVQAKVSTYMAGKRKPEERKTPPEIKSIKVPIPTFPPTAMVYSIPKSPNTARKKDPEEPEMPSVDIVSAAIMAKVLEERERERACVKHCDTCTCSQKAKLIHSSGQVAAATQTEPPPPVIIKTGSENVKAKSIPVYVHEQNGNNVAKVQPNNFLLDSKPVLVPQIGEKSEVTVVDAPLLVSESAKSATAKGGRHCSMRLQTGSKNILLDNTPNDVSPVLYTTKSVSSKITKPSSVSSEDSKTVSSISENTSNLRVAQWIQSNATNNISTTSDYSESVASNKTDPSDDSKLELDRQRYKEMEDNVKRFLFGEFKFMNTVEIGKHKYDSARQIKE